LGGPKYIQALRGPFPQIPFVPTGGVNLETAADYIRAGAAALGVGGEMISKEALKARDGDVISKLSALFVDLVRDARFPERKKQTGRRRRVRRRGMEQTKTIPDLVVVRTKKEKCPSRKQG